MEPLALKTCKTCCKEINSSAKKCPYCQHWQYKMSMIVFHPVTAILVVAIVLVALGFFRQTIFSVGEDFTAYRDQIEITETELKFGENECGSGNTVVVMGTMLNSSDVSWVRVQLEVQFYDGEKNLIDTEQENKYFFMVPANDSTTFKVSIDREFPEEQYDSCQVRILSAKDERAMF